MSIDKAPRRALRQKVGCALRYLLGLRGVTQTGLAAQLGIPQHEVSHWCTGKAMPQPRSLARVLVALNTGHAEFCALVECPEIALFDDDLVVAVAAKMPLARRNRNAIVRFINLHAERKSA